MREKVWRSATSGPFFSNEGNVCEACKACTHDLPQKVRGGVWAVGALFRLQTRSDPQLSARKEPALAALQGRTRASALTEWRRTMHCLQAMRGDLPGAGDYDRSRCASKRWNVAHHALRPRHGDLYLLRAVPGGLPGRRDRRTTQLRIRHRDARRTPLRQGAASRQWRSMRARNRQKSCARCSLSLIRNSATAVLHAAGDCCAALEERHVTSHCGAGNFRELAQYSAGETPLAPAASLPRDWRATPTKWTPFLAKLVSSTIHASIWPCAANAGGIFGRGGAFSASPLGCDCAGRGGRTFWRRARIARPGIPYGADGARSHLLKMPRPLIILRCLGAHSGTFR